MSENSNHREKKIILTRQRNQGMAERIRERQL